MIYLNFIILYFEDTLIKKVISRDNTSYEQKEVYGLIVSLRFLSMFQLVTIYTSIRF